MTSLVARFERQADTAADRVAVATPAMTLTYDALRRFANRVAHALLDGAPGGGDHVALLLEHDAVMPAAILGVLKAGKSYVALDAAQPDRRLAELLVDSGASVLLASPAHVARARELAGADIVIVDINTIADTLPDTNPAIDIDASQRAYLLYTSGSTGRPKGIAQTHRSVAFYADAYIDRLGLTADDRLTLLSSYCHDAAVVDIFSALLSGACLCPIDLKQLQPGAAVDTMLSLQVTVYHSVPSVYRRMLDAFAARPAAESLRYVVLGGEIVHAVDFHGYVQRFPDSTRFVNLHGSTEASINAMFVADKQTRLRRTTVPIGQPVNGIEMLLLDDAGQPTEVFGELVVRSPHVAPGYWNDEATSQRVFMRDAQGARIYRTGDKARRRPDGSFEFAGRKDQLLKVHGYRVEPAEIEAAMAEHPAVREVAVVGFEPAPMELELAGYFVTNDASGEAAIDWREFLGTRLPGYMIPIVFIRLEAMPVTVSGKIDRRALPAPGTSQSGEDVVAPRTPLEEALVRIWSDVLGHESIGIHNDFFSLGGHSLRAMQVLARIHEHYAVELPVRAVFDAPTVAELAQLLSVELKAATAEPGAM